MSSRGNPTADAGVEATVKPPAPGDRLRRVRRLQRALWILTAALGFGAALGIWALQPEPEQRSAISGELVLEVSGLT